jgi:hypothetical protein
MAIKTFDDVRSTSMSSYERSDFVPHSFADTSVFTSGVAVAPSIRSYANTSNRTSDWSADAIMTIKDMWSLNDGWDSYGAMHISVLALDCAAELVEKMKGLPKPFIAPTSEGGVMFEWHRPRANFVIEVSSAADVEIIYRLADGEDWSGNIAEMPLDPWRMADILLTAPSQP